MWKVGHRGAPSLYPENTLLSFEKALELGCDALEFDLHQCASGELVIIHDKTLERTTTGKGMVAEKTFSELKKLHAGKGEKLLTLPELFEALDEHKETTLFIEMKSKGDSAARQLVNDIHTAVHSGWKQHRLIAIGFGIDVLHWVKLAAPEIPLGLSFERETLEKLKPMVETMRVQYIIPHVKHVDKEMVKYAHEHNLKVIAWTAKTKQEITRLKKLNVDGVMVDDPKLFS